MTSTPRPATSTSGWSSTNCPRKAYADADFALRERLESLFGRPVDLVTAGSVEDPFFGERIEAEHKPVHTR